MGVQGPPPCASKVTRCSGMKISLRSSQSGGRVCWLQRRSFGSQRRGFEGSGRSLIFKTVRWALGGNSVVSDSLRPHGPQHARPPCPSPTPEVYSNSCPLSQCCHPTISSYVIPFSSCLQSFPASGALPMSQFFASGSQSIGTSASASVLPMNIQG